MRRVDLFRPIESEHAEAEPLGEGRSAAFARVDVSTSRSYTASSTVTSLCLSRYSPTLIAGVATGETVALALPSLQAVRTFAAGASPSPINYVAAMLRPPELGHRAALKTSQDNVAVAAPRPVAQLARSLETEQARSSHHVAITRLSTQVDVTALVDPLWQSKSLGDGRDPLSLRDSGSSAELQVENDRLRGQLGRAIALNDALWSATIEKALAV